MDFKNLLLEIDATIATVTLNRPRAMNALNRATLEELQVIFAELEQNSEVKVIILTGAGGKAFVAGADIPEMQQMNALEARAFSKLGQQVMANIEQGTKPVIAAINGFALGGGCELAMACDIRLASEKAKFGQPEVNLGVIPGFAGAQRLSRLIGKGRAKELLFTGDMIDGHEAVRIGLANKVVPVDQLLETATKMARKIASKGPLAVSFCKDAINKGLDMDLDKASAYEAELFALCFSSNDQKEGMTAFLEKRPADFKGN